MKAVLIKTNVPTSSGLTIPAGSICVVSEGLCKNKDENEKGIPAEIALLPYVSKEAYIAKKAPVSGVLFPLIISDFLSVDEYEKVPAQDLLIGAIYKMLNQVFPGEVEIIDIKAE
jgi:hypothetical protein